MELFPPDANQNLLPCDGIVNYHGPVLPPASADSFYQTLYHQIPWQQDEAILFGKRIVTARKVAWYGDSDFSYTYSGTTKSALPWTPALLRLKQLAETLTRTQFNSCLLNLYHDGSEGMAWHSDDERSLARHSTIASISLGAERTFRLKHKQLPLSTAILLEHGSLLTMKDTTQSHWLHCVPKSKKITTPRINLTFRTMASHSGS
jgi:alkylated DNA repair dioxygenase AlkB